MKTVEISQLFVCAKTDFSSVLFNAPTGIFLKKISHQAL